MFLWLYILISSYLNPFSGLKYQHWSKVLNALAGLKLCMLTSPIPERGVVLGGSLALHGKTVSLACFHGVNFRAQSWVLFNLKQFYTEFNSKVRLEEKSCQVRRVRAVQTLLIRLGHGDEEASLPGNFSPTSGESGKWLRNTFYLRKWNQMKESITDARWWWWWLWWSSSSSRYFAWIRYLLHDISKFNLEVLVVNINNTFYYPKNMLTNYLVPIWRLLREMKLASCHKYCALRSTSMRVKIFF